jgi:cytoskeletal protein RodZ
MLGDKLRAERERQSLTIKDIEQGTSIRALYIDCIEKGAYEQLPGEVYTKGFIRNYANFLKLDADAFVREFNEERHPEEVLAAEEAAAAEEEQKEKPASAFTVDSDFKVRIEDRANHQNKILAAVVCLLVLGGAYFLFSTDSSQQMAKAPQSAKQVQTPAKEATKAAESKAAAAPAEKHDDVEVVAKFDDRCWTQVIADGQTLYEGTMEKGKTMSWKGKEKVSITAGNAGAVALSVNGQDMGKVGETGQVVEKVFTPAGEKKEADKEKTK